ncbi:hypothetical protein K525DRAFT_210623 [Schizophyllum commune Loenen D]|nr:hypothetical protein K525DRAFT_210623 [Schizophyllum commune Loenen D]
MVKDWDYYTRTGIDLAGTASSYAFSAAKGATKLGFAVTRKVAETGVSAATKVVDLAVFGNNPVTNPLVSGAVSNLLTLAEQITLAPIHLSEYITSTSLLAAHSSINVLSVIFPGSSDASFSLASFITLVKREWNADATGTGRQFGLIEVGRAMVAWVALQGVTQEWQERNWMKHLREIQVKEPKKFDSMRQRKGSRIRVTSDVFLSGNRAQIIAADIGVAPIARRTWSTLTVPKIRSAIRHSGLLHHGDPSASSGPPPPHLSIPELKVKLRRLSKLVLAGYGGASLLFFGVSPLGNASGKPGKNDKLSEERHLARAIDASEAEAAGDFELIDYAELDDMDGMGATAEPGYSWWDVLLGKHDHEIFERFANDDAAMREHDKGKGKNKGSASTEEAREKLAEMRSTAVVGAEHLMPRFWVLTDHARGEVVLVLRGTMSLNEIAADLTCEPLPFVHAHTPKVDEELEPGGIPGNYFFPSKEREGHPEDGEEHHVHAGMARMARAMGEIGKPVQVAVQEALYRNPDYDLVLCGHSLGAGTAAILGLMWADPKTCLTVPCSGLPVGRRVSVYCFAPPALTSGALSKLSSGLITSFVYSHDIVARLSLASVRDLKNAAMWLCEAEADAQGKGKAEGYNAVTERAKRVKDGTAQEGDLEWLIAMRKTLEASMQSVDMFPPGRVLWAVRDGDLHPAHQVHKQQALSGSQSSASDGADRLRLFEVLDVEKVFNQIVFARDMLTSHMPHQYDRALHELL